MYDYGQLRYHHRRLKQISTETACNLQGNPHRYQPLHLKGLFLFGSGDSAWVERPQVLDGRRQDFEKSLDVRLGVVAAEGESDGSAGSIFINRRRGRLRSEGTDDRRRFKSTG